MYFGDCRLSKLSYHDAIMDIGSLAMDDISTETSSSSWSDGEDEVDAEEIDDEEEGGGGEGGVVGVVGMVVVVVAAAAALSAKLLAAAAATLWMDLGDKRVSGRW